MFLELNQEVTNKEIAEIFQCSNQGGIRKSNKTKTIVIIAKFLDCSYKHKKDGDMLYFVGIGKKGDQQLTRQNKSLYNAEKEGYSIHCFELYEENKYIYKGEMTLAKEIFTEEQIDDNGKMREVLIFPLKYKNI
ncbi:MAG: hypothetical protein PWP46_2206 [Fusobacteriaceae bacterium]|nr:putative restriction endonuclease [Fusobacteriales bacterium]MDN5305319.1 hypothetical protein [Fusobacteriaceae bacterium]